MPNHDKPDSAFKRMIARLLTASARVITPFCDRSLPPATALESEWVSRLRLEFEAIPVADITQGTSSERAWRNNMNRLRELVLYDDPRRFLRWDVVTNTMFEAYAGYLIAELGFLKRHADWDIRWRNAIRENQTGHPSPFWLHRGSSGNLIHHAYHIAQFEEATNLRVNDMGFILEFGGGYGSMCRLLRNLHFTGKYVIFDLPAFSALQRYFLGSVGLTVHSFESFKSAGSGVLCISDLRQLNEILSNHFDPTRSMFIATWSLSEAPLGTRNQIMPLMQPFHSFLIAYQEHFGEMANVGFFDAWKKTLPNIMWRDRVIPHLSPSRYLVGAMSSPGKGTG